MNFGHIPSSENMTIGLLKNLQLEWIIAVGALGYFSESKGHYRSYLGSDFSHPPKSRWDVISPCFWSNIGLHLFYVVSFCWLIILYYILYYIIYIILYYIIYIYIYTHIYIYTLTFSAFVLNVKYFLISQWDIS